MQTYIGISGLQVQEDKVGNETPNPKPETTYIMLIEKFALRQVPEFLRITGLGFIP